MKNFDEFSSIEQAAMEQSPASETDIRHNFVGASRFLDDIVDGIGDIVEVVGEAAEDIGGLVVVAGEAAIDEVVTVGENVVAVAEVAEDIVEAVAGGVIIDTVFTKKQMELLKSIDQECSVDELIDLRNNMIKANYKRK